MSVGQKESTVELAVVVVVVQLVNSSNCCCQLEGVAESLVLCPALKARRISWLSVYCADGH